MRLENPPILFAEERRIALTTRKGEVVTRHYIEEGQEIIGTLLLRKLSDKKTLRRRYKTGARTGSMNPYK